MRRWLALVLLVAACRVAGAEDAKPAQPAVPPSDAKPAESAGTSSPTPPAPSAAPAAKSGPPLTPEKAADAVLAAVAAKEVAALKTLAAKDDPDPWLVADELIRRAEFDAADAFARAAPRLDVERLPEYVASRRAQPDDPARRARLAAASAASSPQAALEALGAPASPVERDVTGVLLVFGRGVGLAALLRWEESGRAFLAAADGAEAIGWLARAARASAQAGVAAYRGSGFRAAMAAFARALTLHERRTDARGAADTIGSIGLVHWSLGEYAKSIEAHERARSAHESLGNKAAAAKALGNIGLVYQSMGDYAKALAAHERALTAKQALGDRSGAALTLGNLAVVYYLLGDYSKSLATYERARSEMEALGDRSGAAATLSGIGLVYYSLADYAKSLSMHERALTAQEAVGNKAAAARTLSNIGNVHYALGDFAKALAMHERALSAMEALGDRAGAASTLGNMGSVYDGLGDYAKALATYERALAVKEALGDKAGAADTQGNIGTVYGSLGDHAKALATYERVLSAEEALGDRAGAAKSLGHIGNAYGALGDSAKALATHERALAASAALGDRAGAAVTLGQIGRDYLSLGDSQKAIEALDRAAQQAGHLRATPIRVSALTALARARLRAGDAARAADDARAAVRELGTMLGRLGEEQGAGAREQFTDLFAVGAQAAAQRGSASEVEFFLESGRAGSLLEALGGRSSMRVAAIPDELRVEQAEAQATEAVALKAYQRAVDGPDLTVTRAALKALDAANDRVRAVVGRVQREAKKQAAVWYPQAAPLDEVMTWLVDGDALVLYSVLGDDALALVATRRDARIVALGSSSAIRAACEALDATDLDVDPAAALGRLRDLLVRPLGVDGATRLLVSPEGPLCYLPFAALVSGVPLVVVPSGTTYGFLLEGEGAKRGESILAAGDPDYGAARDVTASATYERSSRLTPLPGTRDECKAVGDVLLLGADASEASLRASLVKRSRWRAVHLACHGLLDPERPTLCSLALTPDAKNDGYLTALEVFDLEVPADLVVLSACETGRGRVVEGEGVVGLTRAFMYAGAPRVIASLWKVDDKATRALMVKFYELWNPKDGKPGLLTAEALRRAQEFVRSHEKWQHPYYWAAWVLWGLPS